MLKARLAALAGAATLALAGAGHAAVVPLEHSLMFPHLPGEALGIDLGAGAGGLPIGYRGFAVDRAWMGPTDFTTFFSEGPGAGASRALYADQSTAASAREGGITQVTSQQGVRGGTEFPLYSYLITAGQYVLEVGTFSDSPAVSAKVSPAPLPGAMWLFGSALMAFLWISGRRRL
jgi:hypothetical protein